MDYVLKTNNLCKYYRNFKALNGLKMNVPKGSIYGFVGKNGAGKTTLIRLLCGLQMPTDGDFELYGVKNTDKKISESRSRIGAIVESPSLFPEMTAEENLKYQYRLLGIPDYKGIPELLELVGLADTGKKKAGNFSLGMRQRCPDESGFHRKACYRCGCASSGWKHSPPLPGCSPAGRRPRKCPAFRPGNRSGNHWRRA